MILAIKSWLKGYLIRLAAIAVVAALTFGFLTWTNSPPSNHNQRPTGPLLTDNYEAPPSKPKQKPEPMTITITMVGDVNMDPAWGGGIADRAGTVFSFIDLAIIAELSKANIFYANNEFCFSDRGTKMPGKQYAFRASTDKIQHWRALGLDVAGLANNHVFDYGLDAFMDTLDTLHSAGIKTIGAGRNLAEAMAPAIFDFGDYKVAFVAGTRAEKVMLTPAATHNSPGVLRIYDPSDFITAVKAAKQQADFVIAIPHWGTEMTTTLEQVQIDLGRALINAGADAVIGAHPHVLQGLDYYNDKLIAYSLGNFWFNSEYVESMILKLTITAGKPQFSIIPTKMAGEKMIISAENDASVFQLLRSLSPNITIDEKGNISQRGD